MNKYEKAINKLKNVSYDDRHSTMLLETHREELDNLEELVERATPKKITQTDRNVEYYIEYRCPNCESGVEYNEQQFCDACGQALDWGDEDE